jgi:aminopeptidase C
MLFIGTNGPEGEWQVENSWGNENQKYPYLTMSDAWFGHYVGEIIVHKRYIPKALRDRYRALHTQKRYTYLPFWDIFGTLA